MATHLLLLLVMISFAAGDDGDAMSELMSSLSPSPPGWSPSKSYCQWQGINCDDSKQHVTAINMPSKSLSGSLPSQLSSLSQLKTLALQNNNLSGSLPSLANLSSLEQVFLGDNAFSSIPPDFFVGLSSLQSFSISENNKLSSWVLPDSLKDCVSLVNLSASNASIVGPIPDFFDSFPSLQNLRLSYNNLSGPLPKSFGGSEIQNLWLNNQLMGLSGTIDVLSNMSQLSQVWLQENRFTGQLPDLTKCDSLFDLQLRDNQLSGLVPHSLTQLPNLANISLQNNKLQGELPVFKKGVQSSLGTETNSFCRDTQGPCDPQVNVLLSVAGAMGYPGSLAESWKGNDACAKWTFITCDTQGKNVTTVNFAKQHFGGTISPDFANLTSLRTLLLSDDDLKGSIPQSLTTLPDLQLLDVSNNNLSGPIPVFRPGFKLVTIGNPLLGKNISDGGSGDKPGSGPNSTPNEDSPGGSKGVSGGIIAGVVIAVLVFVVVVLFVSYKCYAKKHHQRFGRVTRPDDGKDLFSDNVAGGMNGIGGVSELQSQSSGDHSEMPVFEGGSSIVISVQYMPQGTLSQHLFEYEELGYPPLSWKQRVTIALDVARGVEYLHSLAQQSFIHRDLKPSNILLGDDMRAKVADFGLVKNAPDGKYSVETRLAGTFGYLAPEYAATGRVTTKVDIYAYGVVLMEIITGRKALDESLPEEISHLVAWFRRVLINKDNIRKAIDQVLDPDEETFDSISKVAELAGHCTARDPLQRPDMGHAVNVLGPLVEQWKPSHREEEESYGVDLHMSLPQALQRWQDEGSSTMSFSQTQSSIPSKPSGFADTFDSTDCR
uniref:non-specific serine/threonine protein kinase n=1 Tax=Daucus carota subsp. sativus TaxID=79200 RepID=A0A166CWW7_DAUCS